MLIKKGNKQINVSPKAFRLFYKEQGYKEVSGITDLENNQTVEPDEAQDESAETKNLNKMKLDELKALAESEGIEGCKSLTKKELVEVLKDVV